MARRKQRGRNRRTDATGRTISSESFVKIDRWVMKTEAWLALTPQERAVYLEIEYRHFGNNNGAIGLSAREAAKLCRINKDTACRAFERLEALGFIKCRSVGHFDWKVRHSSEYELTRWPYNGREPTKEFAHWTENQPKRQEKKPVPIKGQDGPSKSDRPALKIVTDSDKAA